MRLVAIILAAAMTIGSLAHVDATEDPNMLGIYFDQVATQNEIWIDVPGQTTAYLILSSPTMAAIDGWWLGIDFETIVHSYDLAGGGVNMSSISYPFYTSFFVEFPTPLPCTDLTILATLQIGVDEINQSACIAVTDNIGDYGFQDEPGALVGGARVYFWPCTGFSMPPLWGHCIAAINEDAPVSMESATWGSVKSLFK